jgi:hypothetical protein
MQMNQAVVSKILGSGSPKEASSFQVVAMEKEAQASFMHEKRF